MKDQVPENYYIYHHKDCGKKYRGCSPECPKDIYEKTGKWILELGVPIGHMELKPVSEDKKWLDATEKKKVISCDDCGIIGPEGFMLKDEIWSGLGLNKETLCLECTKNRLGREFRISDFMSGVQINELLWLGYSLGYVESLLKVKEFFNEYFFDKVHGGKL